MILLGGDNVMLLLSSAFVMLLLSFANGMLLQINFETYILTAFFESVS